MSNFSAISWREQVNFQWDDDEVRFVLDQHAELDLYSASSLKQQSAGRHVAPLGHIILIPSQPVFALSPECCVLSGEARNTNCIAFGLTRPGLEPAIYRTRGEHANHYATDVVTTRRSRVRRSPFLICVVGNVIYLNNAHCILYISLVILLAVARDDFYGNYVIHFKIWQTMANMNYFISTRYE